MHDILVFTPVLRLEPETTQAIFSLEWDGPLSMLYQRDNPTGDGRMDHLHQYQRGREIFLSGPYDGMLVIESDIIPPPQALKRLAAVGADVAYGCYLLRPSKVVNIFERYPDDVYGNRARNVGESLMVRGLWEDACKRGVIECSGGGLGCILIKRHVLEAFDFRLEEPGVGVPGAHCDSWFTWDVYKSEFSMMADTAVLCGHKTPDGEIFWFDDD